MAKIGVQVDQVVIASLQGESECVKNGGPQSLFRSSFNQKEMRIFPSLPIRPPAGPVGRSIVNNQDVRIGKAFPDLLNQIGKVFHLIVGRRRNQISRHTSVRFF